MTRPNILLERAVQLAIFLRICGDLFADVSLAGSTLTWAQAMSGAACIVLLLCFGRRLLPQHQTERGAFLALAGLCFIGLARAEDIGGALRSGLRVLSPLLILFAARASGMRPKRWVDTVLAASLLPLSAALWHATQGQHLEHVVHGYPRLRGGYLNYHNLALTCAVFVPLAAWRATTLRDRNIASLACVAVGSVALYSLGMTWVRTAWVVLFVSIVVGLLAARQWRTSVAITGVTLLGVFLNPVLSERFADVLHLLSGNPPEHGWGAIGSSRFAIWRDVVIDFNARGPWAWLFGVGLGEHTSFHPKGLDPHLDYLALTIQVGVTGLTCYLLLLYQYGKEIVANWTHEAAPLLAGVFVAALVSNGISNAFLSRPTIAWILFGLIGTVYSARARTLECTAGRRPRAQYPRRDPAEPS